MEPLLEKIVAAGLITQEQVKAAGLWAAAINRSVWSTLVKLEYLSEEQITRFFAQEAQIPYVNLTDYRIKKSAVEILQEHFCRQNTVIPLCRIGNTLFIACANPFDSALMDAVGKLSRSVVEPLIATSTGIIQALDYYWHEPMADYDIADFLVRQGPVKGMPFWRESERIGVDWPVELFVRDDAFSLALPPCIEGRARDISRDAGAIGITFALYLPRGLKVLVALLPRPGVAADEECIELPGEIAHSYMQDTRRFSIGIRFGVVDARTREMLLKRAAGSGGGAS